MYQAGISKTDITPPVGYLLEGHDACKEVSEGVHDHLYLKVITISDGASRVVLITSDLIEFPREFVADLRRDIYEKLKIRPAHVLLTASHTHTGPFMSLWAETRMKDPGKIIPDYMNCLRLKIVGGIIEAIHNEEKVTLRWGTGKANIGAINRRLKTDKGVMMMPNPRGTVDRQVGVFSAVRKNGTPKAILANYACHPTTLGSDIYRISADYPGVYQRIIEQTYPGCIACFTNGCCGDVRPAIISGKDFKGGDFDDLERMGKILADEVMKTFKQSRPIRAGKPGGAFRIVPLPLDKKLLPSEHGQVAKLAAFHGVKSTMGADYEEVRLWKQYWQARLKKHLPVAGSVPCEIQAVRIGNFRMLGIAGEVMAAIGLRIKSFAGNTPLMVCGYANAPIGYIPTAEALRDGGYEMSWFIWNRSAGPYAPAMEDKLVNESVKMLRLSG